MRLRVPEMNPQRAKNKEQRTKFSALEPEDDSSVDRDLGDLPPVVEGHAAAPRTRPPQPAVGARAAPARRRGGGARHRPGGERPAQPQSRRPKRLPAVAGVFISAAGELRPEELVR